jgi:hypothetical protein
MTAQNLIISNEFLLWSELLLLWAIASYGVTADPITDDRENDSFQWKRWWWRFAVRSLGAALLTFMTSHSLVLTGWMMVATVAQPLLRFRVLTQLTAEFEIVAAVVSVGTILVIIRHFHLTLYWSIETVSLSREHLAALVLVAAMLLFVVRGGTYVVRGCLSKAGTLPRMAARAETDDQDKQQNPDKLPTVAGTEVDNIEINRGRLIGNLERLLLTLVVAAGSYAALAFLVAAKGLIRSEELANRDFAEYFLVGSFSSILVALCGGLIIRFALLSLWPELLSLQMQS